MLMRNKHYNSKKEKRFNLEKELKHAFDTPPPARKEQFINRLDYPRASRFEFISSQIGYIRKRVWICSLVLFMITLICLYSTKASVSLIWVVSSAFPFISLLSISEIAKSTTYNMEELEMSCKYNILEVSLIRLGILGLANLALLIGIMLLLTCKTDFGLDFGFIRLGLYLLTPYLLNCYGTLFVINRLQSRETMYFCGAVTTFVSALNILLATQVDEIYTEKYRICWDIAFIILVIFCVKELVKLFKKMEELQWNSSLTA